MRANLEVLTSGGTVYTGHLALEVVREPAFLRSRDPNVGGQRHRCREPAAGVGSWRLIHCYVPAKLPRTWSKCELGEGLAALTRSLSSRTDVSAHASP